MAYSESIKNIKKEDLVYIDETGIGADVVSRDVWTSIGNEIKLLVKGKRTKRQNIIAALMNTGIEAPMMFEGSCNKIIFEYYVEQILCPTLRPEQVVIMDNASFHKSKNIQKLIEACGCRLIYLSPYSPELNPIEHYWAILKDKIKVLQKNISHIPEVIIQALDETRLFGAS